MSVKVHLYKLTLELDTPGGVSAPENRTTDYTGKASLPLARDAANQPYVPATSLAGSLRSHAEQPASLFGQSHNEKDGTTTAVASLVRVLGTKTTLPEDAPATLRRMSTAIDRNRGAAASPTLHERELLPPGTTITAWLRLDDSANDQVAQELERLLPTWSPRIGGARSTGHGRARLTQVTRRVLDLGAAQDRRVWLTQGGPELFEGGEVIFPADGGAPPQPGKARFVFGATLGFEIVDALHIGSGRRIQGGHHSTDLAEHLRNHLGRPVIPGTTWKGLLRSRCEFVLRSLSESASCAATPGCGGCRVCAAFGYTGQPSTRDEESSVGLRGRLVFLDSPVVGLNGEPAETVGRNHVALDRFTGGAATNLLFTDEVVEYGRVGLTILDEPSDPDAEPLDQVLRDALLLALYDLHTGALGIGGGTTRGYGTLRGTADTAAYLEREVQPARVRLGRAFPALGGEGTER